MEDTFARTNMIQNLGAEAPGKKDIQAEKMVDDCAWMVESFDGLSIDLRNRSLDELYELQWQQETGFANRIKESKKGSKQRIEIISKAYETVCQILHVIAETNGDSALSMGMDDRYTQLVVERLDRLKENDVEGGLFEIGFGSGLLLQSVSEAGFEVGGLEVASQLLDEAKSRLREDCHPNLCFGNLVDNAKVDSLEGRFSVVYWNDVFEHIPVDEIDDYLQKIYSLLTPGGELITITPNWHMRPMDVTADNLGPRNTAIGFHLKEYKLSEVCGHLKKAGFGQVITPAFVGKARIRTSRMLHFTWLKQKLEPLLEWLPYRAAVQLCRRFGLTTTIAKKSV